MTEEDLLAQLLELPADEARTGLVSLARQEGEGVLEILRAALERPALLEAALEGLGEVSSQEAWDLLDRVAREGATRQVRKGARRAQHRLRSRGFRPAPRTQERAAPRIEQARATFFDHVGHQLLRVVQVAPFGMRRCGGFIVSLEGLEDCFYVVADRADVEEIIAEEDERLGELLVEAGIAYVARRVRQAVARSRERGKALPEDYFDAAPLLENVPEDAWPEELAAIAGTETPVTPAEAQDLLEHYGMRPWIFPPDRMTAYVEEWLHILDLQPAETEEGLPNLAVIQARGKLTAQVITDLCDEATHQRLAEQLREQARLLYAAGEETLAGIALRCATRLKWELSVDDPFLRALVELSMDVAIRITVREEEEEEEEEEPWVRLVSGEGTPLWVPRPTKPTEEEPPSRLWLPGQE